MTRPCPHCEGPLEWVATARRWVCGTCYRIWLRSVERDANTLANLPGSKAFR